MHLRAIIGEIANLMAWRNLPVQINDLVLDVGSGDNPHVRADVLCDRSLWDSGERSGNYDLIIDGRPFVFANGCKLPFKNKVFDFVICRHLVEHIHNPTDLLEELVRVGKAGYIECLGSFMEKLYGWDFHRQLVDYDNDILYIRPKATSRNYGILPVEIKKDTYWEKLVKNNSHLFTVKCLWKDKIQYKTEGPLLDVVDRKSENISFIPKRSLRRRIRWWITKAVRFFVARPKFKIDQILACPDCHVDLKIRKTSLVCTKCQKLYAVISGNCFKFN